MQDTKLTTFMKNDGVYFLDELCFRDIIYILNFNCIINLCVVVCADSSATTFRTRCVLKPHVQLNSKCI